MSITNQPKQPTPIFQLDASSPYASIGQVITYSIYLQNTLPGVIENASIKTFLSPNLSFIPNSLKINGFPVTNQHIGLGIRLDLIHCTETVTICFDTEVIHTQDHTIAMEASLFYSCYNPDLGTQERNSILSNRFLVTIVAIELQVESHLSRYADFFICYELHFLNTGTLPLSQLLYTHHLDPSTCFISDSLNLCNQPLEGDPTLGVPLPSLSPQESIQISYTCKLLTGTCNGILHDTASIFFHYSLANGLCTSQTQMIELPSIPTLISCFKTLQLSKNYTLPPSYSDIHEIDCHTANIVLDGSYLTPSPKGTSIDRQRLNNAQLIVYGHVEVSIEYTSTLPLSPIHCLYLTIPFSTFVVLPLDYENQHYHLASKLEYVDLSLSHPRALALYVLLLIRVKCL